MKWMLLLLILCGCANRLISTVRARPRPLLAPPPLPVQSSKFSLQSSMFVAKPTTLTLEWDYPRSMDGVEGFMLYRGTNSGSYFAQYPAPLTNRITITFVRQAGEVDYFVCTSTNSIPQESLPSNEVFWPPPNRYFAPTNVVLSWDAPSATVFGSRDLITWQTITNVTGSTVTLPLQSGAWFFRVSSDRQATLRIEAQ